MRDSILVSKRLNECKGRKKETKCERNKIFLRNFAGLKYESNMIVYPNAKINIGLNVVAKRRDGYHDLETVFYPIPLQDALEIHEAESPDSEYELKVSGDPLDGTPEENLVVRAFRLLKQDFPDKVRPVSIYLYKHIPTGAGLGGGSSDGAFMLKALNERFALGLTTEELERYAAQLGADCPFFIQDCPVFAEGIGDVFSPVSLSLEGLTLVLVKPDIFVSTKDAYRAVVPRKPVVSLRTLVQLGVEEWSKGVHNDFEGSVFMKYPEIAAIKDRLYDLGAKFAAMSGSGSAVYGLFAEPVENVDTLFSGCFCRQRQL